MPNLIEIRPRINKYISFSWQVNNFCNFRCSYCNEGNWSGTFKNDTPEQLAKMHSNLRMLINYYKDNGYSSFKFFFGGGEPSLWKGIIPTASLIREIVGDNAVIGINSNLSRKLSWWEKNYHYFNDVVASFHPEFANEDTYLETCKFLQTRTNYLCLRMMILESKFDYLVEFAERARNTLNNYNIEWVPLFEEIKIGTRPWSYNDPRITEFINNSTFETKDTIPKLYVKDTLSSEELYDDGSKQLLNSNRLVAEKLNYFKGWKCNVHESIFISPSGFVKAASCGQGPTLGNIYDSISFPDSFVVCKKDYCHCGTDIQISKVR